MFICRSCARRHVRTLWSDSVLSRVELKTPIASKFALRTTERSYSETSQKWDGGQDKPKHEAPRTAAKNLLRPSDLQKELVFLEDPLKLAEHVHRLLRQDRFNEAEQTVQTASKRSQCTVSWNHLINWQLSRVKVNSAIKSYNEMKKRGQKPDAHTYTIIFRGLAESCRNRQACAKAVATAIKIYHSMDADNSHVQANVIHTNAVLNVCTRAKDMDALYGVVAKLQRRGIRAPNNLTYTIILNAIRQTIVEQASELEDEPTRLAMYQRAIMEARKLWIDVIERWHQGDIFIDEELVCSMGRILLMGSEKDVDDIYSLIEQTMNIPRLISNSAVDATKAKDLEMDQKGRTADGGWGPSLVEDGVQDLRPHDEFKALTPPKNKRMDASSAYVKPGQNSLSLVLEALLHTRLSDPLAAYWDAFTNSGRVTPDSNNFHTYLQNLRTRRASTEAVNLLLQIPKEMLKMKTFRIAMSTCVRDKKNQNSFASAGKIIQVMEEKTTNMDLLTLHKYLHLGLRAGGTTGASLRKGSAEAFARGRQILRTIDRLTPCLANIRSAMAYNPRPGVLNIRHVSQLQSHYDWDLVQQLMRGMIGAYDQLLSLSMVPPEMNAKLRQEKSKLSSFMGTTEERQKKKHAGPWKQENAEPSESDEVPADRSAAPGGSGAPPRQEAKAQVVKTEAIRRSLEGRVKLWSSASKYGKSREEALRAPGPAMVEAASDI